MVDRPHRPGPSCAGLDLIGDEQDPVGVAQGSKFAQEADRSRAEAAFALDRFDDDRRNRRSRDLVSQERLEGSHCPGSGGVLVIAEVAIHVREGRQVDGR